MQTRSVQQIKWASGLNMLFGIWLIIAPFVLAYSTASNAYWNDILIGAIVLVCAAIRAFGAFAQTGWSFINVLAGVWLIIAPFVLGFNLNPTVLWNDVILGALVIIFGLTSSSATVGSVPPAP